MIPTAFHHMGLTKNDPIRVEEFYTKHFGFKRARVFQPGPEQIVMLKSGSTYLELFKATEDSQVPPIEGAGSRYPGWRHICFAVEDLDAKLREMGENAKITREPKDLSNFVSGMRACWIADPEGNIIELNENYCD